jgi:dTDP-4-dehydrorhamnose reductase
VRVVADQIGTPTSTPALAEALWQPAATGARRRAPLDGRRGRELVRLRGRDREEVAAIGLLPPGIEVTPIATEDYPTPARRPACSVLDKRATMAALALEPRHWRQRLREELARLRAAH